MESSTSDDSAEDIKKEDEALWKKLEARRKRREGDDDSLEARRKRMEDFKKRQEARRKEREELDKMRAARRKEREELDKMRAAGYYPPVVSEVYPVPWSPLSRPRNSSPGRLSRFKGASRFKKPSKSSSGRKYLFTKTSEDEN